MALNFEWDGDKARSNITKHKVSFEEASTVFGDWHSATYFDPDHSGNEMRFITIGHSLRGRLIIVAHTDRGNHIRIISARSAAKKERQYYEKNIEDKE